MVENSKAKLPPLATPGFSELAISPDDTRVYFSRPGWGTTRAIYYAEVDTRKVFFFHDANGYRLIDECSDKTQLGRVIAREHSYFDIDPASATDIFTLLDATRPKPTETRVGSSGRLGLIGYGDENVQRFLAITCGVGIRPPVQPETPLAPRFRSYRVRCKDFVVQRDDLKFLDGSAAIRFRTLHSDKVPDAVFGAESIEEMCPLP